LGLIPDVYSANDWSGTVDENDNVSTEAKAYTITYFNGAHGREGDLVEGEKVQVVNGMVFNVRRSDKS